MDSRLHHQRADALGELHRRQHQRGGRCALRLLEAVLQLPVLPAAEPLQRQRPPRAIATEPLEALPVILVHRGIRVERRGESKRRTGTPTLSQGAGNAGRRARERPEGMPRAHGSSSPASRARWSHPPGELVGRLGPELRPRLGGVGGPPLPHLNRASTSSLLFRWIAGPNEAAKRGCIDRVLPLPRIAPRSCAPRRDLRPPRQK